MDHRTAVMMHGYYGVPMKKNICCPVGSFPYMSPGKYKPKGTVLTHNSVELYTVANSVQPKCALLVCPDVWGWNGGRIRAIADGLAEQGYLVCMPKLLADAAGTDGDGLAPDGAFSMEWIKQFPWSTQKAKMEAALDWVKSREPKMIGVLGFCYGGHPACKLSAEHPEISCGVVLHPSIHLEEFAFGGKTASLLQSVQCPFMLCPAGNDLPLYDEEGELCKALLHGSKCGAECKIETYHDMKHGWSCRGDLTDAMTNAQVKKVINHTIAYFAEHLIVKGGCLPPTYKRTYGALPEQNGVAPPVPVL